MSTVRSAIGFWSFIALMIALMVAFIGLGNWQMQRLAEKEILVSRVEERIDLTPLPAPPVSEWDALDPGALEYAPLSLGGRFHHDQAVRIFTSLASGTARGPHSGPGYWLVTPFVLDAGGTVFVNRGFVPEPQLAAFLADEDAGGQPGTITGLVRAPEPAGAFTPAPQPENRLDWVRDPARLAALVDPDLAPFAPFTLDQFAAAPAGLPQAGETVIDFSNNHFGYAMTWYGFALITPVMLGFWIWRQRRRT